MALTGEEGFECDWGYWVLIAEGRRDWERGSLESRLACEVMLFFLS